MVRSLIALSAGLFASLSAALAPSCASAQSLTLTYEARALGLTAARTKVTFTQQGNNYRLSMNATSSGVASIASFRASGDSFGTTQRNGLRPGGYDFTNSTSKKTERTIVDYIAGRVTFVPGRNISNNERVAPGMIASSVDPLTALYQLMLQVSHTGRCDGSTRTFEGRSVANVSAQTLGRSTPSGMAVSVIETPLRCRINLSPVAGKILRPKERAKLIPVDVWLARLSAQSVAVPVKFEARVRGVPVTLVLVGAQ